MYRIAVMEALQRRTPMPSSEKPDLGKA